MGVGRAGSEAAGPAAVGEAVRTADGPGAAAYERAPGPAGAALASWAGAVQQGGRQQSGRGQGAQPWSHVGDPLPERFAKTGAVIDGTSLT